MTSAWYFPLEPKAALLGTECMTMEEFGAYWKLILKMYEARGPVKEDLETLAKLWKSNVRGAATKLAGLINSGRIKRTECGGLIDDKAERVISSVENSLEKKAEAGRKSGEARREKAKSRKASGKVSDKFGESFSEHSDAYDEIGVENHKDTRAAQQTLFEHKESEKSQKESPSESPSSAKREPRFADVVVERYNALPAVQGKRWAKVRDPISKATRQAINKIGKKLGQGEVFRALEASRWAGMLHDPNNGAGEKMKRMGLRWLVGNRADRLPIMQYLLDGGYCMSGDSEASPYDNGWPPTTRNLINGGRNGRAGSIEEQCDNVRRELLWGGGPASSQSGPVDAGEGFSGSGDHGLHDRCQGYLTAS